MNKTDASIRSVAFSPDSRILAAAAVRTVKLWDVDNLNYLKCI